MMKRVATALVLYVGWFLIGQLGIGSAESGVKGTAMKTEQFEKATFAGGCFWCMQPPYDKLKGVVSTTVGYTGGTKPNPTYEEVSMGKTGHAEAVEIIFDPAEISYERLLDVFWKNIDPTTLNQQFADHGTQYRTAIFYHNEEQERMAAASKEKLEKSGKFKGPIVTEITPATAFYPAEEYHQGYYKKCPLPYQLYKTGSGREGFIKKTWGGHDDSITKGVETVEKIEKTDEEWKKELTPEQYHIMRQKGTERAFTGKYWNNKETGMYHCAGCGAPLFSSKTKFDSGTGWPSFSEPMDENNIRYDIDERGGMRRVEVLCKKCGAHLGHVFDDGPHPTGKRFCINSCVLDFKKK